MVANVYAVAVFVSQIVGQKLRELAVQAIKDALTDCFKYLVKLKLSNMFISPVRQDFIPWQCCSEQRDVC